LAGTLILGAYLVFFAPDDSENKADNASSTQEPSETPEVHDADGDGVRDEADLCPDVAGTDANGCPQEVSPPFAATSFTAPDCDSGTNIASIEALDQYTVQFTLCGPDPAFLNKIAFPAFGIQSSDYLEETGGGDDNLLYQPIGTGPYRLENWQRGFGITLTRFDNYWGDPAAMESLFVTWASDQASRWASIDGSDVDGIDNPPDDAASQLIQFYNRPSDSVFYIGLNNRFEPFNDERVRQALAMAIDREELVSLLPNSTLADQFMPPSVFGYTEGQTWYPYDPEFARALLEEAGYADGLYIDLYFRSVSRAYLPNPDEVMEYLASQLSEIGIEVNVVALDSSSFFEEVNAGELPMFALGWIGDYPDATAYLDFHFGNSSTQFFGDNDPEIAALLDEAAHTTNPDAREELYAVVNERIKELVPMIPIAHSSSSTAFNINVQNAHAGTIGIENFAVMNIDGRSRLNWMQSTEPTTLYCADEFTIDSMRICAQINETLVAYEIGGTTLTPHLATQWDVSDDGTAYTFYLREGVTFHDGSTLDANDVVSTFATQLDADHLLHVGHTGDFFFADTYFGIINQ
jgi:ABC-type transport system substrate-binding protein